MVVERGGKTIFGATVGVMMLDTQFPRIYGDIANANTWPFPIQYRIVKGASPDIVVRKKAEGLLEGFIQAGKDLVAHGADGLTTNCGFLALIQDKVRNAIDVPVATSSLMQVPMVNNMLGNDRRAGIITISKEHLTDEHLRLANVPLDTPIIGTEGGREFTHKILDDLPEIDFSLCLEDLKDAARDMVNNHKDVGGIVLECTNMAPYAAAIRKITKLPVYSIYTHICWLQSGLVPRRFPYQLDDPRL